MTRARQAIRPQASPATAQGLAFAHSRTAGQPLDRTFRTTMEQRFGHDFSGVRVHTGGDADRSARAVDARAFTLGRDIVFRSGSYAPHSSQGRRLLTHELTHVVQHSRAQSGAAHVSHPHDAAEREAGLNAAQAEGTGPLAAMQPASATLQRDATGIGVGIGIGVASAVGLGFTIAAVAGAFSSENFTDQELQTYLALLQDKQRPEGNLNSDNKARAVVKRWKKGAAGFSVLIVPIRVLLIKEMAAGYMGDADQDGILDLIREAIPAERAHIFEQVGIEQLKSRFDGTRRKSLDGLIEEQDMAAMSLSDAWTVAQTQKTIERHGDGGMLRRIFAAGYKIFRFKTAFDKWRYNADGHTEEAEATEVGGNTDYDEKKVRIRESLSNEVAASTIAHEGKHATLGKPRSQQERLEGEVKAREDEEGFRYRHGQSANVSSARTSKGGTDTAALRQFVTGSDHYNPTNRRHVARRYDGESPAEGWDLSEPAKAGGS